MSGIVKTEGPLPMPSEDIVVLQVINKKTKFLIGKKPKQMEIVEANKEKLMQMTPQLSTVLMVKCRHAKEGEVVELKATTGYSNDVLKLIVQFSEKGHITCSDWTLIARLASSIGAYANPRLIEECRRLIRSVLKVKRVWKIINLLGSLYNCFKLPIAQMLAEKPDECIHTLDLDKLGLPTVHAFADLGPIRNNQSLKKIDKAFNKMALSFPPGNLHYDFIQRVRSKFALPQAARSSPILTRSNLYKPIEALMKQEVFASIISSQIKPSTPPPLTPNIENFNPLNVYPDTAGADNSFQVDKVPVFVKLCFKAETDLCLVGIELLSRSFAPATYSSKFPKRFRYDVNYTENLDLRVTLCYGSAERAVLTMKINGMGTRSSSRIIRFEDEVFVPKGFLCSVQLHILEPCWYTKVTKPKPLSEFFARDGQLLLNNVTFRASGVGKIEPRVCPISKVLLRPVSNDCILLQD